MARLGYHRQGYHRLIVGLSAAWSNRCGLHAEESFCDNPPNERTDATPVGRADGTRTRRVPGNAGIALDSGPGVSALAAGRCPVHEGVRPTRVRGIPRADEHGL